MKHWQTAQIHGRGRHDVITTMTCHYNMWDCHSSSFSVTLPKWSRCFLLVLSFHSTDWAAYIVWSLSLKSALTNSIHLFIHRPHFSSLCTYAYICIIFLHPISAREIQSCPVQTILVLPPIFSVLIHSGDNSLLWHRTSTTVWLCYTTNHPDIMYGWNWFSWTWKKLRNSLLVLKTFHCQKKEKETLITNSRRCLNKE